MTNRLVGKYLTVARYDGIRTSKNAVFNGTVTQNGTLVANSPVTLVTGQTATFGGITQGVVQTLASSAAPALVVQSNLVEHTPTQNETINIVDGQFPTLGFALKITTSGTTSYTINFGTNFVSQGALTTGTTSGKIFVILFGVDGSPNWVEFSRTIAM